MALEKNVLQCTLLVLLHGTIGENESVNKCIEPLNDAIVKAETTCTYDFRKSIPWLKTVSST